MLNKECIRNIKEELSRRKGTDVYTDIAAKSYVNNLEYLKYSDFTIDRCLYDNIFQMIDIRNCIQQSRFYKIPYELADIVSISIAGIAAFGSPVQILETRITDNYGKGMDKIAKKYDRKYNLMGRWTLGLLDKMLVEHQERALI